jgi:hypothetical protein
MLFQEFLDSFESAIVALITRTHVLAEDLQRMEGRLSTIRDVSSGEVKVRLAEKAELLADLWTWFGGNKRHLAMLDRSLQSLRMLYEYHGLADRCVASAQAELRGMREALEGLRPLVSDALVLESDFSIEAIVEQIRLGGERVRQRQREISNHRMADGTRRPVLLSSTDFDD